MQCIEDIVDPIVPIAHVNEASSEYDPFVSGHRMLMLRLPSFITEKNNLTKTEDPLV